MDNAKVQFVVFRIEEKKLASNPYKVEMEVSANFDNLSDANKYKEAKDSLLRFRQANIIGVILNTKYNKFFSSPLSKLKGEISLTCKKNLSVAAMQH